MVPYNIIRPADHDEWLAERQKGIGSSDACILAGLHNYGRTPLSLYTGKTDPEGVSEKGNRVTERGHKWEPVVAFMFEMETGNVIFPDSVGDWIAVSKTKPFLRVSPDRIYHPKDMPLEQRTIENGCLLECKTIRTQNVTADNIPLYWWIQVQYQMGVLGLRKAALAWISSCGDMDFGYTMLDFDEAFFSALVDKIESFWKNNVLKRIKPTQNYTLADVNLRYPASEKDKKITSNNEIEALMKKFDLYKEAIADLAQEAETIQKHICEYMGDAERLETEDKIRLCSWSTVSSSRIDSARLKKEMPQIYAQYTNKTITRQFRSSGAFSTKRMEAAS